MMADILKRQKGVDRVSELPNSKSDKKLSSTIRSHRHINTLKTSNDLKFVKLQQENATLLKNLEKSWRSGSSQRTRNPKFNASSVRFNLTDNNW